MSNFRKITFCFLIIILNFLNFAYSEIYIAMKIDEYVITNYDIKKEISYLKILNKSLNSLSETQLIDLAKKSLKIETIKKKEISRFKNIDKEKFDATPLLNNLIQRLQIGNINIFSETLKKENSYDLTQVKDKIKYEYLWNTLIFEKFNDKLKIDREKLIKKINSINNQEQKEFLLSEIIFKKKKNQTVEELINQIKFSIDEIGFENTANLFSVSESSKLGGLIGWISEKNLSLPVISELNKIKVGQFTNVINSNDIFIILKINEIKISEIKINRELELQKLIQSEKNNQLAKFSRVYFEKISMNYFVNEK